MRSNNGRSTGASPRAKPSSRRFSKGFVSAGIVVTPWDATPGTQVARRRAGTTIDATGPTPGAGHTERSATTLWCVPTNLTRPCGRRCWSCSKTRNSSSAKSTEGLRWRMTREQRDGEPTRCMASWHASKPACGACLMPTRKKSSPSTSSARGRVHYKLDNSPSCQRLRPCRPPNSIVPLDFPLPQRWNDSFSVCAKARNRCLLPSGNVSCVCSCARCRWERMRSQFAIRFR